MMLSLINETFTVASIADCDKVFRDSRNDDYMWRETEVGCKVLLLLQEIHKFNITYIYGSQTMMDYFERKGAIYELDQAVDIYVKPRSLWLKPMYNATPISPVFVWKFGFILRRPKPNVEHCYSLPFSATVWHSLLGMTLLVSGLFYILNRAEQRLAGDSLKCSFWSELLVVFGVCCQHYISITPMVLTSRRIAFITFFFFSYVLYSYYTSTLLSELVHDKDNEMDLETLADSTYGHVVLDSVAVVIKVLIEQIHSGNNNMSPQLTYFIQKKLTNIRVVNITTGLAEVKTCGTALLSDYASLYAVMKDTYTITEVCEIIHVPLFSNVLKYFFTSKDFKYVEQFKISTLRAKETGVLQQLLQSHVRPPLLHHQCVTSNFQAHLGHVTKPLIILALGYVLCVLILIGERIYYKRYRVWPYVE